MILDRELMACGAQSESLSHIRMSRFVPSQAEVSGNLLERSGSHYFK